MLMNLGRKVLFAVFFACFCVAGDSETCVTFAQDEKEAVAIRDFNGAVVVYNGGLYAEAEKKWQEFLQKHPDDKRAERATHFLGICQLHLKKFPEAATTFRSVLSKYPNFANRDEAFYLYPNSYWETGFLGGSHDR